MKLLQKNQLELKINPFAKNSLDHPNGFLISHVKDIATKTKDVNHVIGYLAVLLSADKDGKVVLNQDASNLNIFINKNYEYLKERALFLTAQKIVN